MRSAVLRGRVSRIQRGAAAVGNHPGPPSRVIPVRRLGNFPRKKIEENSLQRTEMDHENGRKRKRMLLVRNEVSEYVQNEKSLHGISKVETSGTHTDGKNLVHRNLPIPDRRKLGNLMRRKKISRNLLILVRVENSEKRRSGERMGKHHRRKNGMGRSGMTRDRIEFFRYLSC